MEILNEVVNFVLHNNFYTVLVIVSILVVTAFAMIFAKNYKEYKETAANTYDYSTNDETNKNNVRTSNTNSPESSSRLSKMLKKLKDERKILKNS